MEIKELARMSARYYDFANEALKYVESISLTEDHRQQVYHTCFRGFLICLKDYLLLIFDDISKTTGPLFPKSNVNKVLIRNALESIIILNIIDKHPELIERYYDTYLSDITRIKNMYNNEVAEGKYLRRFSWLPRIKGRKANSLSDLLNYVEFEDDEQKEYYQILIRNLDNFIHPSFHIGKSIENQSITNVDSIAALFMHDGIMDELCTNLIEEMHLFYGEAFPAKKLLRYLDEDNYYTDAISTDSNKIRKNTPIYASNIGYSMVKLFSYLFRQSDVNYRAMNLRYLFADLAPRYDDMIKAFYSKNSLLFEIQVRTIIESLAMIHIIMKEDERRNYIFYIHQQIKGYEATKSALALIAKAGMPIAENNYEEEYLANIEIVRNYYANIFKKEVSNRDILRLNGWALYLNKYNNDVVPNALFIVDNLLNDFFPDSKRNYYNAFFEESNAYTHITMYAFLKNSRPIDKSILIELNMMLSQMVAGIMKSLKIDSLMTKEELEEYNNYFFMSIKHLNEDIDNTN